jgi:hypothetical protein
MKGGILLCLAVAFLFFLAMPSAYAITDYYTGKQILPSNYLAPRMDCKPNGQQCALLAYDNTTKRIQIFLTNNRFSTSVSVNRTLATDANVGKIISKNQASAIPYDVAYMNLPYNWNFGVGNQNPFDFGITYKNQIYGINSSGAFGMVNKTNANWINGYVWFIDHNTEATAPQFIAINRTSGGTIKFIMDTTTKVIDQTQPLRYKTFKNWCPSDYIGGIVLATDEVPHDYNQSYILFPYNSSTNTFCYSNTTDDEITSDYDGVFNDVERFASNQVFARNSTYIFRYSLLGGAVLPFFNMATNNILSQDIWTTSTTVDNMAVVFRNSSGIYLWNTFVQPSLRPDEYNLSLNTFVYGGLFKDPHKPKVACSADMSQCAMLVYDAGIIFKGIHLLYSIDSEHEIWTDKYTFTGIDYDAFITSLAPNYQLPYDIAYNEETGKWRIFYQTNGALHANHCNYHEWDGSAFPTLVGTCGEWQIPLSFADINGNYMTLIYGSLAVAQRLYVAKWLGSYPTDTIYNVGMPPPFAEKDQVGYLLGISVWVGTGIKYEIKYYYHDWTGAGWTFTYWTTYRNFDMFDDFAYTMPPQYIYADEKLSFFERNATVSPIYGEGMYYAGTTDWSNWLSPSVTPYYIYNQAENEDTYSDSKKSGETGTKYYAISIKKGAFPFYTLNNIYFYQRPFYRTIINAEYFDVPTLSYRTANISVSLDCTSENYTAVGVGDLFELYTPCTSYDATYETTQYRPYTNTKFIQFISGCDYNQVWIRLLKSYEFKLRVVDDVTLQPISGATVNFGGSVKLTNTNGYVNYTTYPLTNESIIVTSQPSLCLYYLTTSASSIKSYNTIIYKAGYNEKRELINPAIFVGGQITYYTEKQINLLPTGSTLTVRLIDRDGNEMINSELNSITTVGGSQTVYVIDAITGETLIQDSATGVPVQFYLADNRTTFNVTVNFSYTDFTDSQTVEMQRDVPEVIYFRLNLTKTEIKCTDNLDCQTNFCDGSFFYKLEGCISGRCSYKTPEICAVGCDPEIGCYARKFTTRCDTRYDCNSTCLTGWKSAIGLCASDGYCVQIDDTCELQCAGSSQGCNATSGLCCDSQECYISGKERFRFLLQYQYSSTEDLFPTLKLVPVTDYDFWCGVENKGERVCISGDTIPESIVGTYRTSKTIVSSTPESWTFELDKDGKYNFFDIAVECGVNCQLTTEFCKYGCDRETTYCKHSPTQQINITQKYDINIYQPIPLIEDAINKTQLKASGLGFLLMLATPLFFSTIIALLIGAGVGLKTKSPQLGFVGFIALLAIFSLLGLFPIWLILILIIIAGIFFGRMMLSIFGAGGGGG